jgi:putative flippase GtrA
MPVAIWQALRAPGIVRRAARFGVSGLLVTGLHVLIAAALIEFLMAGPALANGVAFLIATTTSYLINTLWSFSRTPGQGNLLRFLFVAGFGLLLTVTITGIVANCGLSYWIGILCAVFVVPPSTFLAHTFWTYR